MKERVAELMAELDAIDATGSEPEATALREKVTAGANIDDVEEEILRFKVKVERRKRDRARLEVQEKRRRDEMVAEVYALKKEGLAVDNLQSLIFSAPLHEAEKALLKAKRDAGESKRLIAELEELGAGQEAEAVRALLMDLSRFHEGEEALVKLKHTVVKGRREAAQKAEEERRTALRRSMEAWKGEGYYVAPLLKVLDTPLPELEKAFADFGARVERLKGLQAQLDSQPATGFEREVEVLRGKLKDVDKVDGVAAEIEMLAGRIGKRRETDAGRVAAEEKKRKELGDRIQEWKTAGYNTARLDKMMAGGTLDELRNGCVVFRMRIQRMKEVEAEIATLDISGLEGLAESLRSKLLDPERVAAVEAELTELKLRLKRRREDDRKKREDETRRRSALNQKLQGYFVQGYAISHIEPLFTGEMPVLEGAVRGFEAKVARLRELERDLASLDASGLEGAVEEVKWLLKDVTRLQEAEEAVESLKLRVQRTGARRKLMMRLRGWVDEGYTVEYLEDILTGESDMGRVREEFERFGEVVERLKTMERELAALDTAGFEREAIDIRSMLRDTARVSEAEQALTELKGMVEERRSRESSRHEERLRAERDRLLAQVAEWRGTGFHAAPVEALLNNPAVNIDTARKEVHALGQRVQRLREMRAELASVAHPALEQEVRSLEERMKSADALNDLERAMMERALRTLREKADRLREEEGKKRDEGADHMAALVARMEVWVNEGFNLGDLDGVMEKGQEEAGRAIAAFENGVERMRALRKEVEALEKTGVDPGDLKMYLNDIGNATLVTSRIGELRKGEAPIAPPTVPAPAEKKPPAAAPETAPQTPVVPAATDSTEPRFPVSTTSEPPKVARRDGASEASSREPVAEQKAVAPPQKRVVRKAVKGR